MPKPSPNFEQWAAGLGAVEEDHLFPPPGRVSPTLAALLNERVAILEQAATGKISGDTEAAIGETAAGEVERAVGSSYADTVSDVDARIAAQVEAEFPDAPRMKLRGISDDDMVEIQEELAALTKTKAGEKMSRLQLTAEANLRMVARAVVEPPNVTTQDMRLLRKQLTRGEWARLLAHVGRLADLDAEVTDLPN